MDTLGAFDTLAQVALGIAGFSGVVVAVSDRAAAYHEADSLRVQSLLIVSVGALVLSLLPSGLALAKLPEATIWRAGSAAFLVLPAVWFAAIRFRLLRAGRTVLFPMPILGVVALLSAANLAAQVLNVVGVFSERAPAVYYFGIVWLLVFAAMVFANVVFRRPGQ